MADHPTKAIAQKATASIPLGFQLLKEGHIDAFASAGNTGAMLVGAMFSIKTIPGVIRPAMPTLVPKLKGGIGVILDVGANADCRPDNLLQRSEEHTSELQSLMRISYAVFCLKKKNTKK